MDDNPKPGAAPLNELSEPLRQAVDQVRKSPVPADVLNRALEKAEKLGALPPPQRRSIRWPMYVLATAAGMVIAIGVWQFLPQQPNAPAEHLVLENPPPATNAKLAAPAHDESPVASPASAAKTEKQDNAEQKDAIPARPLMSAAPRMRSMMRKAVREPADAAKDGKDKAVPSPAVPAPVLAPAAMPEKAAAKETEANAPRSPSMPAPVYSPYLRLLRPGEGRAGSPAPAYLGVPPDSIGGGFNGRKMDSDEEIGGRRNVDGSVAGRPDSNAAEILEGNQAAAGRGPAGKGTANAKNNETLKRAARVWKRNNGQPSFARVYIGDGNSLELVSLDVQVTIEGPRARTIVDHVFRNPHPQQLEGTFEYPLPSGASPSYFAMFLGQSREAIPQRFGGRAPNVAPLAATALASLSPQDLVRNVNTADWGRLQEARVVAKEKALEVYEEVVRGRIDPALLEYASGNTFRGRVFPIPPRGYNRVILAYEELLPVSQEKMVYRFTLPEEKLASMHFTLQMSAGESNEREFLPKGATIEQGAGHVYYTRTWRNEEPKEAEVVFSCTPVRPELQAVSGRRGENGPVYAYARVRPDLKKIAAAKGGAAHAVFLLDTSLSEYPARFDVSMKLLKAILEQNPTIEHFNVVAFNAAASWVAPAGWLANSKEGRESLFKRLDGVVLEGATDIGSALNLLAHPPGGVPDKAPVDCFLLSDGHATWGETEVGTLVARFETNCPFRPRFHCYLTGLGAENAELFEALTRRGGATFSCRNQTEVAAAAVAHRNECLRIDNVHFAGGPAASDVLVGGRRAAVYPGGELIVAGRFPTAGHTNLIIEGTFAGERFVQEYPIDVMEGGDLAPRGWAEIAVGSLLALNDPKLDSLVTAYCQQFNIGSRVASFLVLENEADYKRFNLEEERGRTAAGDLGAFLDRMWNSVAGVVSAKQAFMTFLDRIESRPNQLDANTRPQIRKLASLMADKEFDLPANSLQGALLHKPDVPPDYLAKRDANRFDVTTFIAEARRRANAGDVNGAVRVLSSIIEDYPSRGDALRLVGYRLLDLKQPAQAAQLFERVQQQRPFEPHSYRDLARALEDTDNFALAALQYEIILGGTWHNRFGESIKLVAREEYARLMQDAIKKKAVSTKVADYFGERLEHMPEPHATADLRVTISWNTDATDVDLWVFEPDGTKCFYQHNRTKNGGELSQDQTQGYGPERYQVKKALKGKYRILVHYYNSNPNLLAGETHVNVAVTQFAGTPKENTKRYTVILHKRGEEAEVCEVEF